MNKSTVKLISVKSMLYFGLMLIIISLSITSYVSASDNESTSSESSGEEYTVGWWRSVRKSMWTWEGADWNKVQSALQKIKTEPGERRNPEMFDTIKQYGPGHWIYEWSAIGEVAYKQALKHEQKGDTDLARKAFLESSIYYTQASYPHFRDKFSKAALAKAFETYQRAGRYFSVAMEAWEFEVEGAQFKAFIHFPQNTSSEALPVILKTGGMDVLSTEFYPLSKVINKSGAAMIVYDSPGTGNDGIVDANYEKHHIAVLKRVLKDKRFDSKRIGIWSESLAGITAVKMALGDYKDKFAAAVNSCGPMHALYALELTGGAPSNYDVQKLINAYNKGQLSQTEIDVFNTAILNPYLQGMLLDFQGVVFVDRVRAEAGNVLDILAKSLPISLIEQGLLGKKNTTNTPILTINTHADPLVPANESQMVSDASIHGKSMIYDGYEGHCVSRSEIPTILQWLSYHLNLDKNMNTNLNLKESK